MFSRTATKPYCTYIYILCNGHHTQHSNWNLRACTLNNAHLHTAASIRCNLGEAEKSCCFSSVLNVELSHKVVSCLTKTNYLSYVPCRCWKFVKLRFVVRGWESENKLLFYPSTSFKSPTLLIINNNLSTLLTLGACARGLQYFVCYQSPDFFSNLYDKLYVPACFSLVF